MITLAKQKKSNGNGTQLGFEETLWEAADLLRGSMDASEYKHVVLGLIFLKYISDTFETRQQELVSQQDEGADPEDKDEYLSEGYFWVPQESRWSLIQSKARDPKIGEYIDSAMMALEKENPRQLRGILPKDFSKPSLDKTRLGQLIDKIGTIGFNVKEESSKDILGRTYEYFLGKFARAEGKRGGEFFTTPCVVRTLVEMIEPYQGRVYDPCCGSGGMFIQSEKFIKTHGGKTNDIAVYGQEFNPTTWRMARMNLAIHGIEGNLGPQYGDTFSNDLHKDMRADFILANPPFNLKAWGGDGLMDDVRWKYGVPPTGNANYAWIQHMIHHLAPKGIAGFVLANGSLSSNTSSEGEIRKSIIEADLVDCIVALPGQLFYTTQIPVCLWFISKDKSGVPTKGGKPLRERRGETLFIDARKLGTMVSRIVKELTEEDIRKIADTYHAWRNGNGDYEDVAGFCKSASLEEIRKFDHVLTPGRYVGAEDLEDDGEPFEEKMERLTTQLFEQMAEGQKLDGVIRECLGVLGYEE